MMLSQSTQSIGSHATQRGLRDGRLSRRHKGAAFRAYTQRLAVQARAGSNEETSSNTASRRSALIGGVVGGAGLLGFPYTGAAVELPKVPLGRPLPKSIPPTSAVIKGCWQLSGGHRGDAATDRTTGQKAVDDFKAFVDVGVTTFDSGPEECGYGPSEALVGQFLCTGYGGAAVQANTKLCFVGQEQRSNTIEYVEDKVNRSISRFGRNINLMQLYWNDYSANNYVAAALAMTDLKAKGKLGGVAYTNFNTDALERMYNGGAEMAANQIQYSLLDRRPELKMNDFCAATGMKLLPYGVVAGGFLGDAYLGKRFEDVVFDTNSKRKYSSIIVRSGGWEWFQDLLKTLRVVGDRHNGQSISNVASRWVLDKESVGGIILGARNANHVNDHRRLFTFVLTAADKADIQAVLDRGKKSKGDCYDYERGGIW